MSSFSVHVLGGCYTQTKERNFSDHLFRSSVAIETESAVYLLDTGDPAAFLLKDQELSAPLRGIFVSHLDADHVNGLWAVLGECAAPHCLVVLPVPATELPRWESAWAAMHFPWKNPKPIQWVSLEKGFFFQEGDLRIETHPTNHWRSLETSGDVVCRPYADYLPCFAFRVLWKEFRFIYSADYTSPVELEDWLDAGANLALLECAHVPVMTEYARLLASYHRVALMALTHFNYTREDPDALVRIARSILPVQVAVLKTTPGMEFRFEPGSEGRAPRVLPFSERIAGRRKRECPTAEEIRSFCRERGIPVEWQILGPFDNERSPSGEYTGLEQDHGVDFSPDLNAIHEGKGGRRLQWNSVSLEDMRFPGFDGRFDLARAIGGEESLAYATAEFEIPSDGSYDVLFSSDDGMNLWIDGAKIFSLNTAKGAKPDEFRRTLRLAPGKHRALLAIEQRFGGWMFYFRVTPSIPKGKALVPQKL